MKANQFEVFLKRRNKVNFWDNANGEYNDWFEKVTQFILIIKEWLAPFEEKGLLAIKEERLQENLGFTNNNDVANKIVIQLDPLVSVIIEPHSKYAQKRNNKIEMIGPNNSISIIYSNKYNWMFRKNIPVTEYEIVTKESFFNAIYNLSNHSRFY